VFPETAQEERAAIRSAILGMGLLAAPVMAAVMLAGANGRIMGRLALKLSKLAGGWLAIAVMAVASIAVFTFYPSRGLGSCRFGRGWLRSHVLVRKQEGTTEHDHRPDTYSQYHDPSWPLRWPGEARQMRYC
jgi:hypothetical protein